ncbi:MAG TPA: PmoA family protein [Acidimicrobiales bacterium]
MRENRWQYVHEGAPKPYVHPLTTPQGLTLTRVSPPDHEWHRGLWFAIKFVDGDNFWEEDPAGHGVQRQIGPTRIDWVRPDGSVALHEERHVDYVDGVGVSSAAYALDWTTRLSPPPDARGGAVLLDRTPYTTWGGYGGLTIRGAADWEGTRVLLADGSEHRRPEGVPSPWADLSNDAAGITILDHPSNPRHPVPWYGASRSRVYGEGWSNFLNAALLFHEPMTLEAGDELRLRYRVVVHDGRWGAEEAGAAWRAWVG